MRPSIWKGAIVGLAAMAAMLLLVGIASADQGPHGNFTATTGKCQACHTPHRAVNTYILRLNNGTGSQAGIWYFCTVCHGTGGDARNNVVDGVFDDGAAVYGIANALGDSGKQLNAGRFGNGATATHPVQGDPSDRVVWGGNATTGEDKPWGTMNLGTNFKCTSCHDPHGMKLAQVGADGTTQANGLDQQYRMLKYQPVYSWEDSSLYTDTGATKSYTRVAWKDGVVNFCTTCHADYKALTNATDLTGNKPSAIAGTNTANGRWAHMMNVTLNNWSGTGADGVVRTAAQNLDNSQYKLPVQQDSGPRYYSVDASTATLAQAATFSTTVGLAATYNGTTDKVVCTTCHNPHGSTAADPQTYGANAATNPSLLRFSNRAVCQACHAKGLVASGGTFGP